MKTYRPKYLDDIDDVKARIQDLQAQLDDMKKLVRKPRGASPYDLSAGKKGFRGMKP